MTEREWDACTSPTDMFDALTALCYPPEFIRQLVVRVAGLREADYAYVSDEDWPPGVEARDQDEYYSIGESHASAQACKALLKPGCTNPAKKYRFACAYWERPVEKADLIREQVGNPFAPPFVRREWLTSDVLALARGILSERAFDRMPVLGDALMDADCHDEAVLGHCRQDKPHHDGCWLLSLLLGANGGWAP